MAHSLRPNLRFEQLEEKKLLAGDVTVAVIDGALLIDGDDLGNQIEISSGENPGEYLIRGLDGTVVHLADDTPPAEGDSPENGLLVAGVRRGIHISMNGGDDAVHISDARVRGNVVIETGEGADHVSVGLPPAPIPAPLSEGTASGEADQLVHGVSIGGSLLIRTGEGEDNVRLGGRPPQEGEETQDRSTLRVGHSIRVGLGEGEDHLVIDAVHARRAITANGGEGGDEINVANTQTRFLGLDGGGGEYADSISLHNVRAARASIATGEGSDQVEIADSAFGMLGVRLGDGNDTVAIGGTEARLAVLMGGDGQEDTWNNLGGNHFGRLIVRGFELPEPVIDGQPVGESV